MDNTEISKAYEIVSKLIEGFLYETKDFQIEADRRVLAIVKELGRHCAGYSEMLRK